MGYHPTQYFRYRRFFALRRQAFHPADALPDGADDRSLGRRLHPLCCVRLRDCGEPPLQGTALVRFREVRKIERYRCWRGWHGRETMCATPSIEIVPVGAVGAAGVLRLG